jgi:hypothetical protein
VPATCTVVCDPSPNHATRGEEPRGRKQVVRAGKTGARWCFLRGSRVDAGLAKRHRRRGVIRNPRVVNRRNTHRGRYALNPSWYVQRSFADDRG